MRLRLKADGRVVEILADGSERALPAPADPPCPPPPRREDAAERASEGASAAKDDVALYSRSLRGRTKLTQAQFAARIGVPLETVRNWEQGKRVPGGPARALLKVIERAPDLVFAALAEDAPAEEVAGSG
jgi:putative transcriptional regulator